MIDHVLLDVIGALRHGLEAALLEQQAVEERFQVDVFLGDVTFETSYSLPGEQVPPRVRADISLEWPTWSQSAFRSWSIGEQPAEPPEVIIEIALRLQRLAQLPDPERVLAAIGAERPLLAGEPLEQTGPTIEQTYEDGTAVAAIELSYEGAYHLNEKLLENPSGIEEDVAGLARFIASGLVRLADLDLPFLPATDTGTSD